MRLHCRPGECVAAAAAVSARKASAPLMQGVRPCNANGKVNPSYPSVVRDTLGQVHSSRDARAVVVHMADLVCSLRDRSRTPVYARHSLALEALQVRPRQIVRKASSPEGVRFLVALSCRQTGVGV